MVMWKRVVTRPACHNLEEGRVHRSLGYVSFGQTDNPPVSATKPQDHLSLNATSELKTSLSSNGDQLDNIPASSTPDLIRSSNVSSCATSPDVPLAQVVFTARLHALLQAIQDQQREDASAFSSPQDNTSSKTEWITVSRDDKEVELVEMLKPQSYDDGSDESSNTSSARTLGVWAPSPYSTNTATEEGYCKLRLTQLNKRKHDALQELDGTNRRSAGALDNLDGRAANKKVKYEKNNTSTSSLVSYRENQSASYRKLRSLTSETSPSVGSSSQSINPPPRFSHPIIHPPIGQFRIAISQHDVAKRRIQALLDRERSYRVQDGLPSGSFDPTDVVYNDDVFGMEADVRREVVQWIFDILPPNLLRTRDLYRHLKCSEETRFHAMYLFSRYVSRAGYLRGECGYKDTSSVREPTRKLLWHIAFCCLAISIKFHHDFLYPLFPIYTEDFLTISPQLIGRNQFEHTQRDILEAFNYEIFGVTPQAFFEELWAALPSLQEILNFWRPREIVRNEMWAKLQRASLELDLMRFPVSLLTAAALVEGIVLALVDEYQQGDRSTVSTPSISNVDALSDRVNLEKAYRDVIPICSDVAMVLGMSMADLRACRLWMKLAKHRI